MAGELRLIIQSIKYYRKPVSYQVLIIVLLCAIITGSFLTGSSVRQSLKKSASDRLGNADILISSGIRYFNNELARRMKENPDILCCGILETTGYCQAMNSQKGAFSTHIYGIEKEFFVFQGHDSLTIKPGEIAINKRLADYLRLKPGDDLIIRFKTISDIPADAPFAPGGDAGKSVVMRVGTILESVQTGNFSMSISQITPMNIFMNLSDIESARDSVFKINRLIIKKSNNNSLKLVSEAFKHNLKPQDIGLRLREVNKTGEIEIISDRVFIDESLLKVINDILPMSAPVITYLGNRFNSGTRSTPYSFISALPSSLYRGIGAGNEIIINRWMANDLSAKEGDIVKLFWYSPDSLNKLIEKSSDFTVKRIVDMNGIWSDSLLMPDFPGIAGKESCAEWDAGVPIKMHQIRTKDEDYWNKYRGTPKAFISYTTGRKIWGNNFGPATSIRYPAGITKKDIEDKLNGSLDPLKVGFMITDLSDESVKAANESVDFSTLFLSLSFFLILSSLVLLSFAVSLYFDSKKSHIFILHALGFKNSRITRLLFIEAGFIGLAGCSIGVFAGYLVNILITTALNTVWNGAVQTDTLKAYFNILPLFSGFFLTFLTILVLMLVKVKRFLKILNKMGKEIYSIPSSQKNRNILIISSFVTVSLVLFSLLSGSRQISFLFASGTALLLTFVFLWRQYYIGRSRILAGKSINRKQLLHRYYSFNPSGAVTPILFIAAGIFTVFITGVNKMNSNENTIKRSGGTGGYLLWCENTIPVKEDMNSETGKKSLGLGNDQLSDVSFVQMKKYSGNDASCLNLNHITTPPLLGIDPDDFITKQSFSFSKVLDVKKFKNPWQYLNIPSTNNTFFGIADQTVLEWGLKLKTGDTLILRAENGQPVKIIIAAGLQSSVFQGNLLIGKENFTRYFPSVSGFQVFLADGNNALTDQYKNTLEERLESYGTDIEKTSFRLASFYRVTNTYLSVFAVFGAFGMIIGIAGLGFVLLRNYNQRKKEFAIMLAAGFRSKKIRSMILSEQLKILIAGVTAGVFSALLATSSSIINNRVIPWLFLSWMILAIIITGLVTMLLSVRSLTKDSLITSLKKE
jgi:ABC-type antimicrobial peptide transport system permease subunit